METKEIEKIEQQKLKLEITAQEWKAILAVIEEVIDEELK